jgi:integral membrane protein (TIGR00529 family)
MLNLIGVIIAFALIIILIRKKFNFGLSLIIGSLILGVFSLQEINAVEIPKAFVEALIYSFEDNKLDTLAIELALLLLLIYILAKCMQETNAIQKLIDSFRTIFYKGGILGLIPAIYGLMPVPGGALFSAPMIDKEGNKFNLENNQKNFLNVWWRHIWFPIFPISSAMMTICSIEFSNIDIYDLIIADIPAFIAFFIIGFIFLRFFIKKIPKLKTPPKKDYTGLIFLLPPLIPILIYILIFLILFLNGTSEILKDYQIKIFIIGVVLSIFFLFYLIKNTKKEFIQIIKRSISFNLVLAIFGILIFREMIEVSNANIILANLINQLLIPPLLIIIIIPLILGLITGYNLGAVLLSYFLVEPFFNETGLNIIGLTSIIFISSLVGYLISPIHLCNVVSSDYLKTDTTRMYKMYIPAIITLLLIQTTFVFIFFRV